MNRPTHVILEMALPTLSSSYPYMCCRIGDLRDADAITIAEDSAACDVIMAEINCHTTLAQHLHYSGVMPVTITAFNPEYLPHARKFYNELIARLRAEDTLWLIIESAYHCAYSNEEIHRAINNAGLPETSDETIAMVMGQYTDYIKER